MPLAVAAWPSTINVTNFSDYGETWDTNFVEFAPDVGPPKSRRRMSISSDSLSPVMYMTTAEVDTLRTFYRTTLKDGTLPFTFPMPRTGVIEQFRFTKGAPQIKFADYGLYQVSMTWQSVPNTRASWLPLLTVTNALIPSIAPDTFADFTTEGSTDPHYWYLGNRYASFATWLAAMGGTYSRASVATYFRAGLLQTAAAVNAPRFPTDASSVATGLRLVGASTEGCLWNRDLTNAAWSVNLITRVKNQTGIDGVANSATLLTATGANGAIGQTTSFGSNSYIVGAWAKRITGTGTILLSIDGGATTTTIVPTASWQFFPISAAQTLANPQPLIKIVTNGDAIAVDFVSLRTAATPIADPIATTTATAGQGGDMLSFPYSLTTLSAFARVINELKCNGLFNARYVGSNGASNSALLFHPSTDTQVGTFNGARAFDQTILSALANDHKMMVSGNPSGTTITSDGQIVTSDANPLIADSPTSVWLGSNHGVNNFMNGDMKQFALWSSQVASVADLVRITT